MAKLPDCDCTARCGDDPGIHDRTVKTCKRFDEQEHRMENNRIARELLTELGVSDKAKYDNSGLVSALKELQQLRLVRDNALSK
jgi:hypothetical protein